MSVNTLVKLNLSYIHRWRTGRSRIGAGAGYIAFGFWLFCNFVVLASIGFHRYFYILGRPRGDLAIAKLCAMMLTSMLINNVIYYIVL